MDKLKIVLQYCYPKHAVSRLVGKLAQANAGWLTTFLIKVFIKKFNINMQEAQESDPKAYKSFNEFFTRPLKEGVRPIVNAPQQLAQPVDGAISQLGPISQGRIIQAKGRDYSVKELLGGDQAMSDLFEDGQFATIYLAPKDYHRIHMPIEGTLKKMTYIPGELFSVNPLTAQNVDRLFARNERVVCLFDTPAGPMVLVLVGATIVASIETTWAGTVTPPRGSKMFSWSYENNNTFKFAKGDEMGRFKLGSTVIALFAKDAIRFNEQLKEESITRMGEHFASYGQ